MGIDVHLGSHLWVFHVPKPMLVAAAVIAIVVMWKLRRVILAAITG
jgi:hypothetical protein